MIWLIAGATLPSMLIAWAAAYLVRRYGPRLGLVDRPGDRKVHTSPMPTGGGVAIWLGIVGPFALGQLALWTLLGPGGGEVAAWARLPEFIAPHLPG
ncbi:MAG: undecaprenyl/decaprenyl-phosphate alpha-N-acetylglucosaminyl 1-phosphate transferase, partial [Planctomycetota bacterium]